MPAEQPSHDIRQCPSAEWQPDPAQLRRIERELAQQRGRNHFAIRREQTRRLDRARYVAGHECAGIPRLRDQLAGRLFVLLDSCRFIRLAPFQERGEVEKSFRHMGRPSVTDQDNLLRHHARDAITMK